MTDAGVVSTGTDLALTSGLQQGAVKTPTPWMVRIEQHKSWPILSELPIRVIAGIPLSRFRVRDLLGLMEGQIFESTSPELDDIPLESCDVKLGWCEFEVLEQRIGVRLTRLA